MLCRMASVAVEQVGTFLCQPGDDEFEEKSGLPPAFGKCIRLDAIAQVVGGVAFAAQRIDHHPLFIRQAHRQRQGLEQGLMMPRLAGGRAVAVRIMAVSASCMIAL